MVCFALVKPDVIIRGILYQTLEAIQELGFHLVEYRCGKLTKDQFELMNQSSFHFHLDCWDHNYHAYTFGPATGLLLAYKDRRRSARFCQSALSSVKGVALPHLLSKDTLRYRLRASSRTFNILHIPDDSTSALRESEAWFGVDFLNLCLKNFEKSITLPYDQDYPKAVYYDLLSHGYLLDRELNAKSSWLFVIIRMLHIAMRLSHLPSSLKSELASMMTSYHGLAQSAFAHSSEYQSMWPLIPNEGSDSSPLNTAYEYFIRIRHKEFDPLISAIECIRYLNTNKEDTGYTTNYLWHLLSSMRVFTSDLERYLINTAFVYKG